jgi:hypothetical protein
MTAALLPQLHRRGILVSSVGVDLLVTAAARVLNEASARFPVGHQYSRRRQGIGAPRDRILVGRIRRPGSRRAAATRPSAGPSLSSVRPPRMHSTSSPCVGRALLLQALSVPPACVAWLLRLRLVAGTMRRTGERWATSPAFLERCISSTYKLVGS